MKIVLAAINAKYIHSNLAVYYLRTYAAIYKEYITIREFTINNSAEEILKELYTEEADVIAFSCYIWNMSMIWELTDVLKKVRPGVKLWLGGPEVTYHSHELLRSRKTVDGIVIGEGEQIFLELMGYYVDGTRKLEEISGIVYRDSARLKQYGESPKADTAGICCSEAEVLSGRKPLPMDDILFPYEDLEHLQNRIIYYESSRGCPYSCSYCLSSADRGVRLRSLTLVKKELQFFLDRRVTQVKFVDRTFNCNKQHAIGIWQYIREHDNGITNFHFEITADILTEEELNILSSLRPGQVQLEIGVQTTNPDTMGAIRRRVNFQKLSENVERIRAGHNIHQHLDLIAGLPLENLSSFKKSFNDVYRLKPDQLQLGFLKLLKGSPMEKDREKYGIVCRETPPYEVLFTGALSFEELLKLKGICEMVEVYYNSGQFVSTMEYLEHFFESPVELYEALSIYYEAKGHRRLAHSRMRRYEILVDFYGDMVVELNPEHDIIPEIKPDRELFAELLLYDMYLREDLKSRPYFAKAPLGQKRLREIREAYQLGKEPIHVEQFTYDIRGAAVTGKPVRRDQEIMFRYDRRDPISYSAETTVL